AGPFVESEVGWICLAAARSAEHQRREPFIRQGYNHETGQVSTIARRGSLRAPELPDGENAMKKLLAVAAIFAAAPAAHAADAEAGKQLATTVCAACHGANGVSVSDPTPNLAAQRAPYIEAQLKAYKDGTRKLPGAVNNAAIMSAVATQLSADQIANVAAYY